MRVIAGRFRGRTLVSPADRSIRPTSDRVREAVFNIIEHGIEDFAMSGARVLDLFAGTGALGIEALSRGAAYCLLVEEDPDARALIRQNVESFGLTGITKIYRRDATDLGDAGRQVPYHLIFLDPPYGKGLAERALASAAGGGWLQAGALAVLEESADAEIVLPQGFLELDARIYGDTQVRFARYVPGN